jgi:hypothetical protein
MRFSLTGNAAILSLGFPVSAASQERDASVRAAVYCTITITIDPASKTLVDFVEPGQLLAEKGAMSRHIPGCLFMGSRHRWSRMQICKGYGACQGLTRQGEIKIKISNVRAHRRPSTLDCVVSQMIYHRTKAYD